MALVAAPIAPIPGHSLLIFLLQLGVLLLTARLFGALATRIGMPAVVGELLAGVLLGPSLLARVVPSVSSWVFPPDGAQFHLLDAVGQVGVLLLVGVAGMQLDIDMVRRQGVTAANVSLVSLLVPLGFGIVAGLALPVPIRPDDSPRVVFALFMGVAICVSAIPVIARTLVELKLAHRNVSQLIMTAGMIDDAIGWFLLSVVTAMATQGVRLVGVMTSVGVLLGVAVFATFVGRPLVRVVMRVATRSSSPAAAIGAAVTMLLLSGTATHALGFEAILGTFICGALIGSSGVKLSALTSLNTVVISVLAPIFFATAGLRMDLSLLWTPALLLAAFLILVIAVVGKFLGAFICALTSSLTRWEALALGAGLNSRGVIQVIIAMVGLRLGVLGAEAYTVLVLVAVVTSIMAPPILLYAMAKIDSTEEESLREMRSRALFDG